MLNSRVACPYRMNFVCALFSLGAFACTAPPSGDEQGDDVGDTDATEDTGDTDEGESSTSAGTDDADASSDTGAAQRPNWHEDIAPLVYEHCVGCHRDGGIAPFALEEFGQASAFATLMHDAVQAGTMPPWGAQETEDCQPMHGWKNDMRLSDEQKQLVADWLDLGTPEGDPADAVELPEPPSLELENPTVNLVNPAPYTVGGTQDSFKCMVVDPGNEQDVWITGMQIVPDNAEVVHHVLTYIDTESVTDDMVDQNGMFDCPGGLVSLDGGNQISSWVPGGVPMQTPPEVGFYMPVGAKIVMAYHYHPTGAGDQVDQSSIDLRWTTEEPEVAAYAGVMGAAFSSWNVQPGPNDPPGSNGIFEIPPDVSDHLEVFELTVPSILPPVEVFTVGSHMHYIGVDMKVIIERDGEELCYLQTPNWDFDWQRLYDIDLPVGELPTIQGGDILRLECTYDNTLDNPAVAELLAEQGLDAPVTIGVGEQSLEEMCVLLYGVATNLPIGDFL